MVKLEIIINDNGTMSINGPIDNLLQCYGMLEIAKDTLRQRMLAKQAAVQPANIADLMLVGKRT